MKILSLFLVIFVFTNCVNPKKSRTYLDVLDTVDSCIFSIIEEDKIYDIMTDFGTYENFNNITMLRINILFNFGFWGNQDVFNEDVKNNIIKSLFETFSNKDFLKKDDINLYFYHPIKILFSKDMLLSDNEKESIRELLENEFQLNYVLEIYENYCEVFIINSIDLNNFIMFMKNIFGEDIKVEL